MILYTEYEGGYWHKLSQGMKRQKAIRELNRNVKKFEDGRRRSSLRGIELHSVLFPSGLRWDALNGINLNSHFNGREDMQFKKKLFKELQ